MSEEEKAACVRRAHLVLEDADAGASRRDCAIVACMLRYNHPQTLFFECYVAGEWRVYDSIGGGSLSVAFT